MKLLLNIVLRLIAVAVPCWLLSRGHPGTFLELVVAIAVLFATYAFFRVAVL